MKMVYRCAICRNAIDEARKPEAPQPIEGSNGLVWFKIVPICGRHEIPTHMSKEPK